MKVSKLIAQLEELKARHGDVQVVFGDDDHVAGLTSYVELDKDEHEDMMDSFGDTFPQKFININN